MIHVITYKDRVFSTSAETLEEDCRQTSSLINEGWTWVDIDRLRQKMRSIVLHGNTHYIEVKVSRPSTGTKLSTPLMYHGDKNAAMVDAHRVVGGQYGSEWVIDVRVIDSARYVQLVEALKEDIA